MGKDLSQIPQKDSAVGLHSSESHSNVLVEFGRSAFYSGVLNPLRSLAQIADEFGETHIFDDTVKTATNRLGIEAPKEDKFGTTTWYAQQLGGAVGMMVDYAALRRVTNVAADKGLKALGKSTLEQLHTSAMKSGFGSTNMTKFAGAEAGLGATSGYLYGSLLTPSDEQHVGSASFWADRNRQGLDSGAAFGVIGGMSPYMGRAFGLAANALEKAPAPFIASSETMASAAGTARTLSPADTAITYVQNGLAASLRGPILPGVISGVPIGAVNAEVNAIQGGNLLPEKQDLKEEIVSMMFVGGAIGAGNWLAATRIDTGKNPLRAAQQNGLATSIISLGQEGPLHGITYDARLAHPNEGNAKAPEFSELGAAQIDERRAAIRSDLKKALSQGDSYSAKEVIDLKRLTAEDLRTGEIRNAAKQGLAKKLSTGDGYYANEIIKLNLLTAEDLKTDEIRDAAKQGLAKNLLEKDGYAASYSAKKIIDLTGLTAEDLKTDEIRNAAKLGIAKSLSEGNGYRAKEIIDLKLLTAEDLKKDEFRDAAKQGLAKSLSQGFSGPAREIIELTGLTANDLKTEEFRDAAKLGIAKSLSDGAIFGAMGIIDLTGLTAEDLKTQEIRDAAKSGIAKNLSHGAIYTTKEIIALTGLKAEDLKTEEIREAAQQGLAENLSQGFSDKAQEIINLKLLDPKDLDECFKETAQAGHITAVIRQALSLGTDLNTAFDRYLGIAKLTDENATKLFADLKSRDASWHDQENIQRPFEQGAAVFGAARMLRYVFKANATPHDALFAFRDITQLYERSGLSKDSFYNNILRQANRDDGIDDSGSSFSRLNTIAKGFPTSIDTVLEKTKSYPDIPTLQKLAASLPDEQSVFASWQNLQRFSKLQQFMDRVELLPQLQQLRQKGQTKLADWVESLAFHPDSKVATQAILDFWQKPEKFLDYGEVHTPETHEQKKPSNYTDIPHLDLSAKQLRDALIDGTLDRMQVFSPMQVEYEVGGPNIADELKRALGSRQTGQKGEAKNPPKLFSEVNKLLKPTNFNLAQIQEGVELPAELRQQLDAVLYNNLFGAARPTSGLRLIAEIHKKSDPLAVVAGDDTASCMGFGTGKNNVYMFNPNDALFTVRLVRADGTSRTIAQSVLTKDKDVKVPFTTIMDKMRGNDKAALHTIFPQEALRGEKTVIAADNVEVHPNYQSGNYPAALQSVYRDFFGRYVELHSKDENLRDDKIVIGFGYSDAMNSLPKEPNTYVPQAPVGYTDKSRSEVFSLSLKAPPTTPLRAFTVSNNEVDNRIKPQASAVRGVTPLTFEDTLSLAYIEGKVFQDSPSLRQGLHNMENALIAKDINNAAKDRPNLSVKYTDSAGKMKGYLLAYEGEGTFEGTKQPIVFIGDLASDGRTAADGSPVINYVGGKLLLEFGRLYKENYLDKGEFTPIFANARDKTSYSILMKQIEAFGEKVGCRFEIKEIGSHQADSSTMHDVLIIPHPI